MQSPQRTTAAATADGIFSGAAPTAEEAHCAQVGGLSPAPSDEAAQRATEGGRSEEEALRSSRSLETHTGRRKESHEAAVRFQHFFSKAIN